MLKLLINHLTPIFYVKRLLHCSFRLITAGLHRGHSFILFSEREETLIL